MLMEEFIKIKNKMSPLTKEQLELFKLSELAILDISLKDLKIQVCGPVSTGGTDNVNLNLKKLEEHILFFSEKSLPVFNQLKYEKEFSIILKDTKGYDFDLLNYFYLPILRSGLIKLLVFIDGWETSVGAKWEKNIAEALSIPCIFLNKKDITQIIEIFKT